jgi:peroxiredoxin Q/BCP
MAEKTAALGSKVPDFSLPSTSGTSWKPAAAAGRNLVIYFYPRDNTSGCTKEGLAFRDLYPQFRKAKTEVVGVSTDSLASHDRFKAKYDFPFDLLADEEKVACRVFDVSGRGMYGNSAWALNAALLIDAKGVQADTHGQPTATPRVLAARDL